MGGTFAWCPVPVPGPLWGAQYSMEHVHVSDTLDLVTGTIYWAPGIKRTNTLS